MLISVFSWSNHFTGGRDHTSAQPRSEEQSLALEQSGYFPHLEMEPAVLATRLSSPENLPFTGPELGDIGKLWMTRYDFNSNSSSKYVFLGANMAMPCRPREI